MNEFDQFMKHEIKVKNYARYTDDFVVISKDKGYLEDLLPLIQVFLKEKLLLDLHPKKVEIRECGKGIDFLGYIALPYHIVLRTKTRRRMIRKLHERVQLYKTRGISEKSLFGSLNSYMGVLTHANAHKLENEVESKFWYWLKE